jgi:hypothetical protein
MALRPSLQPDTADRRCSSDADVREAGLWQEPDRARGVQRDMRFRLFAVVLVAVVALGDRSPAFSRQDEGLELFRRMQDALGGAAAIAGVRDFEELVRAESFDGNTGRSLGEVRKRTRWIGPNQLRIDQVGAGATYVLYSDGSGGWEILPGTQTAIPLVGGELEFARNYVRGFTFRTWLADRDSRYRITSPSPNLVRISDGDTTHQRDITLDPTSFLPVKVASITLSDPSRPMPSESVTTEWETVNGIRFARRWEIFRSERLVGRATAERIRVNGGLRLDDLDLKPTDGKPVLQ